jgi:hypothetical protein
MPQEIRPPSFRLRGIVSLQSSSIPITVLTVHSFTTFLAIPLDGLLYVYEHYRLPKHTPIAQTNKHTNGYTNGHANEHTATPALIEKPEEGHLEAENSSGVEKATV